jgi:hypothetical protein
MSRLEGSFRTGRATQRPSIVRQIVTRPDDLSPAMLRLKPSSFNGLEKNAFLWRESHSRVEDEIRSNKISHGREP